MQYLLYQFRSIKSNTIIHAFITFSFMHIKYYSWWLFNRYCMLSLENYRRTYNDFMKVIKGEFPQTTMWIGWVSNFTNPTLKVWADLDNPFKRSDYAKLCMSPSLDGTLPEYIILEEDNSPFTLCIDFHNFFYWISVVLLIKFIHKCM